MADVKIVVIGAGSTYTPELIDGLIEKNRNIRIKEVAFYDTDKKRLKIL